MLLWRAELTQEPYPHPSHPAPLPSPPASPPGPSLSLSGAHSADSGSAVARPLSPHTRPVGDARRSSETSPVPHLPLSPASTTPSSSARWLSPAAVSMAVDTADGDGGSADVKEGSDGSHRMLAPAAACSWLKNSPSARRAAAMPCIRGEAGGK